jgi:cytosine/adenosine deaminase-related metal-dependent hydrolase
MNRTSCKHAIVIAAMLAWTGLGWAGDEAAPLPLAVAPVTGRLLVTNALFMTMAEGQKTPFTGYMLAGTDGKIAAMGAGDPPAGMTAESSFDAGGKFIIPGFISAHSHIWQSANRGLGAKSTLLDWIGSFMPIMGIASPEDLYWYTLHGCLDFMRYGITSAYNFTYGGSSWAGYEQPAEQRDGDWEQQQFRAELDSGMRFIHSFDAPLFEGEPQVRKYMEKFIAFTKPYKNDPHFLKLALSGGVAFASNKIAAYREAAYMRDYDLDNQMHFLEPPTALSQRNKFAWIQEAGMLNFGPRLYFGHFIHTTPEIVAAAAKAGCNMVWNPLSNGRLASGLADIPAYLKAGMKVGMGVDDQCASDIPDPFDNMRTGLYLIRDKYEDATIMSPYDVLRLQTAGSATVMRVLDKVGTLEPGKFADFDVIDPYHRDTGPVYDPYATLVLACGQENLERVYIGGELVVLRGETLGRDFQKVADEMRRRAEANYKKVHP